MSNQDVSYNTPIQLQQVKPDGTQLLVVGTGGTLEIDGTLVLGTIALPALPTSNGFYRIQISSGVASWVTDAS
jgi:hypothetical protein